MVPDRSSLSDEMCILEKSYEDKGGTIGNRES